MMIDKKTRSEADSELRWQAEEMARGKAGQPSQDPVDLSPEGTWRLLHELSVHQIELEIQNEELRRMQIELERARERYFNLYDLAPVGYFTLSENGLILEANLTAAGLLGVTRSALVNHSFSRFVIAEDQQSYYQNRKRLVETGEPQNYELRMMRQEPSTTKGTVSHSSAGICGTTFWAQLVATVTQDAAGTPVCRIVISDITERKLTETTLRESQEQTLRSETRLKKAQSVARVGDWVWNIKESQVEWSGEMYSIFGIDNSSYTGRLGDAITQVIHP